MTPDLFCTLFTPTYNRAYVLSRLYTSLQMQKVKSFEWLIVDDGSSDRTPGLVEEWMAEGLFPIRYIRTDNGGKQRAVNLGVQEARGELFFIVDSDDVLTPDALERIADAWRSVEDKTASGGLCFRRRYSSGQLIGSPFPQYTFEASLPEVVYVMGVTGDKAEVFVTGKLRMFPFPVPEGEKFVPEAYVWNRLTRQYPLRFVDEAIYICEYLSDGYSRNLQRNLRANPSGFRLYYISLLGYKVVPWRVKAKAVVRILQLTCYKRCKRKN